jgi:protein ImuB
MSRLQAETCDVTMVRRDVACEDAAFTKLHEIVCRFSPRIEAVAECPGTYALDIRGMNTIFGDATLLATKLRQSAMTVGFLANVGVAENFHVAGCLCWGRAGVSVAPIGCEADALGALPLSVLPLEAEQAETFKARGIHSCAELAALAERDLISRLGQGGKNREDPLLSNSPEPLERDDSSS